MDKLVLLIQDVSDPRVGAANSFSDRLNHRFTVSILGVFALIITTRQYVGEPISCWCPVYFSSSNVDYTNKVIGQPKQLIHVVFLTRQKKAFDTVVRRPVSQCAIVRHASSALGTRFG